jgi:hypothetical protein
MYEQTLPQLLLIPFVPKLMQKFDPRVLLAIGLVLFASSSLMSSSMTNLSAGPEFIVSNLVRAMGQPLIMVSTSLRKSQRSRVKVRLLESSLLGQNRHDWLIDNMNNAVSALNVGGFYVSFVNIQTINFFVIIFFD